MKVIYQGQGQFNTIPTPPPVSTPRPVPTPPQHFLDDAKKMFDVALPIIDTYFTNEQKEVARVYGNKACLVEGDMPWKQEKVGWTTSIWKRDTPIPIFEEMLKKYILETYGEEVDAIARYAPKNDCDCDENPCPFEEHVYWGIEVDAPWNIQRGKWQTFLRRLGFI